ncbi:MAG: hypothetical protein KBD76_12930 [Bacteriovorax sp.]|nr:hypothetical protein [Bacteriovorax sp.]
METQLHYKGQTPIVAYFILKGNIFLEIGAKTCQKLSKGTLLGFYELHFTMPAMFTAVVQKHTEIGYIDKSTLLEIKNSKKKRNATTIPGTHKLFASYLSC